MIVRPLLTIAILNLLLLSLAFAQDSGDDLLTVEERAWLSDHPVIRLAPTPDYRPAEWFDEQGNYLGISSDFMKELEDLLGIEFEVVQTESWTENLRLLQGREIDMFPLAAKTEERLEYAQFTKPYLNFARRDSR